MYHPVEGVRVSKTFALHYCGCGLGTLSDYRQFWGLLWLLHLLCVHDALLARDLQVARASSSAVLQAQSLWSLGCLVELLKCTMLASLLGAPYQVGTLSLDYAEQDLPLRPAELGRLSSLAGGVLTELAVFLLYRAWPDSGSGVVGFTACASGLNCGSDWALRRAQEQPQPWEGTASCCVLQCPSWRSAAQFVGGCGWLPECGEWVVGFDSCVWLCSWGLGKGFVSSLLCPCCISCEWVPSVPLGSHCPGPWEHQVIQCILIHFLLKCACGDPSSCHKI